MTVALTGGFVDTGVTGGFDASFEFSWHMDGVEHGLMSIWGWEVGSNFYISGAAQGAGVGGAWYILGDTLGPPYLPSGFELQLYQAGSYGKSWASTHSMSSGPLARWGYKAWKLKSG